MRNALKRQYQIFKTFYTPRTFIFLFLMMIINALFFQEGRVNNGIWVLFLFIPLPWKYFLALKYPSKNQFFIDMISVSVMTLVMNVIVVSVFMFGLRQIGGVSFFVDSATTEIITTYGLNEVEVGTQQFWEHLGHELMIISAMMLIQLYVLSRPYRIHLQRPRELGLSIARLVVILVMIALIQWVPVSFTMKFIVGWVAFGIAIYCNYYLSYQRYDQI